MKKILLVVFLVLSAGIQAKDFVTDYIAVVPDGFKQQTVTKQQFIDMTDSAFSKQEIAEADAKAATVFYNYLKEMNGLMFEKRNSINEAVVKDLTKSYELLGNVGENKDRAQVFMKEKDDVISEIVVIIYSTETPIICSITGQMPLSHFLKSENREFINVGNVSFSKLLKEWNAAKNKK